MPSALDCEAAQPSAVIIGDMGQIRVNTVADQWTLTLLQKAIPEKRCVGPRNSDIQGLFMKTTPFLVRTFVKIGSFHRLSLFEDGTLPTTDEQQIFTW